MDDFALMRRELSNLSRTRSTKSHQTEKRSVTSRRLSRPGTMQRRTTTHGTEDKDLENGGNVVEENGEEDDFELDRFMKEGHLEKRTEEGESAKKVGVIYKNLTVKGVGSKATFVRTLPDAVIGTFGPDLYRILSGFFPSIRLNKHAETRDLLRDFTGVVRDGEMLLVLGRPGSGCSTFLKAIANNRSSYAAVEGDVRYGGISAAEQDKLYRGEVIYNPEEDMHLPNLNVWQTLKFSLLNKTRKHDKHSIQIVIDALLRMFAITHTKTTLVGNEYVRGVSGGERKRVSIAETLATKSTVTCWDNSTRGLDASTALDYAKSLRIMTDVSNRTTVTTLYQAGEDIYALMDKVLVIEEGRMIYQGRAEEARQYFVDLGFHAPQRQTTADFLTSVGDPNERQFRDGMEAQCPKTAAELEQAFRGSQAYKKVLADVEDYESYLKHTEHKDAQNLKQTVQEQKSKTVTKKSNYTVSFWSQVVACTQREFWLLWGDPTTLYTKFFIIISNGLIVGSLFYGQPSTTQGAFSRGGTAFFSILFLGWLQLSELMKAVSGRAIIARHKEYAFYRPSAVNIARVIVDLPMILAQVIPFTIIMYFLTGLDADAGKFFIYFLFVYTTTLCITALYRMLAALSPTIDDAVRFSGIALNLLIIYTGYVIPKPQLLSQKIWFGWIYYINPISYAFEGVLTNEFAGRVMECAPNALVPQGPNARPPYQGCAISGAELGSTQVTGPQYLSTTYSYTRSNLWRNWGVVIAFSVLYILVTVVATETFTFVGGGGGALMFKKSRKAKKQLKTANPADEEKAGKAEDSSNGMAMQKTRTQEEVLETLVKSESVFTWNNVEYTVPTPAGDKKLLNGVNGYAKPGVMVALMGASGAGKTTLLNTLSQRQKMGVVSGDMLVDGRPLGIEFQRGTGFVEQMDLHDDTATIREALEFSALLRQDRSIPKQEKIDYVDKVIDLLELNDIQDAIIQSLGVEQKKRLTIGVELAAKPSLLLFLDEPTSGLDSQSAFSIVRFLKKLCAAGQAIICTIHQPSSMLIQQFDMILALNPGGNTFYFGPVGEDGKEVIKYFANRGAECPPGKNVAEFILETAAKPIKRPDGQRINWNKEWRESNENAEMLKEIDRIKSERSQSTPPEQSTLHEFAAPVWTQILLLTQRMFTNQWRDPSYLYGKLFTSVIIGIFNGFTFYNLGNSVQDMQNRMFTSFLILLIPPTIVNAVVPKFYQNRALWEARELPSRIYGWVAFCTASCVTEIPSAIVSAVVYWLLWYFPTGLPRDSSTSGYVFLMTMLFFLFQASWGQWICAFAPSFTVISNVLPFFFVMFSLFNGVVVPYSQLSVFWRYWMYWINPSQWWISGVISATLRSIPVQCTDQEAAHFNPPPGNTCMQYAGDFVRQSGMGYLTNPDATSDCGYCQYRDGVEFMSTLNVQPDDKWRDFGIFLMFVFTNWALVFFFIYTVRIKGWSFGLSSLFGAMGKVASKAKGMVRRK
jgi:ATP-binding cassette subfamily G (WHITE) protein 2 (SNQ2)